MLSTEEKLKRFSDSVLKDARDKSNAIIEEAEKRAHQETDAFETKCLEAAYQTIKKEMAQIVRAQHEKASKAELHAKSALLRERERMIDEIFAGVAEKICAFQKTEAYKEALIATVNQAKTLSGAEKLTVTVRKSDEALKTEIETACGVSVTVAETDAIVGGICAYAEGSNRMYDLSYAQKLREAKETFFNSGGLAL